MRTLLILSLSLGLLNIGCTAENTPPEDETLTWGELIYDLKKDPTLNTKVSTKVKELFSSSSLYPNILGKESLFDKFIAGIIQDTISAHLLANIIQQKIENPKGPFENPEEMRIQKNESLSSVESLINKNLKTFCEVWKTFAGRKFSRSKLSTIETINNFVIPTIGVRLKLIITIADNLLSEQKIKDGYKKIYGHVYKNIPSKEQSKDEILNTLAQDLSGIYATYFYEAKNPKKINPADVLHIFHFSWLRDLYQPTFRQRKASTLFIQENEQKTSQKVKRTPKKTDKKSKPTKKTFKKSRKRNPKG